MIQIIRAILITSILLTQSAFAIQTIDSTSDLIIDEGYKSVEQHCATCHSLKLITQSKASRQGWLDTVRWMQKEHGMSLLNNQNEKVILDYLSKNYAPNKKGRRTPLVIDDWVKYQ